MRINRFILLICIFIPVFLSAEPLENTTLFLFDRKVDNDFLKPYTLEENPEYFSNFYAMDVSPYPDGNFDYGIGVDRAKNMVYYFNTNKKTAFFGINTDTDARALELVDKVAATPGGDFYVIDAMRERIYYWNINGSRYEPAGAIDFVFNDLEDICWAGDVLYILDKTGPRLYKYSTISHTFIDFPDGTDTSASLSLTGLSFSYWGQARGMAVSADALFVVFEAGAVLKLDKDGNFLNSFKIGTKNLRLRTHRVKEYSQSWLESIAVDPSGNVYVLDTAAGRIHVFSAGLDYLCSWYDPGHPVDDTATDICFAPGRDYFFLAHTWGFYSYRFKPALAAARVDYNTIYPQLTGGNYKGINIEADAIGSGLLDIVLKGDALETKLVDGYVLQQNSGFHCCWNGKLAEGQVAPEGEYNLQFFFDRQLAGEIPVHVQPAPVLYLSGQDGEVISPDQPEIKYSYQVYGRGILTISLCSLGAPGDNILDRENIVYESLVNEGMDTYTLRNTMNGAPLADGCYYVHFVLCPPELRQYNLLNSLRSLLFVVNNEILSVGSITYDKSVINPAISSLNTITASFSVSADTVLTVDILDADNNVVAAPADHTYFRAGTVDVSWNGLLFSERQAPDGAYRFRVTAFENYLEATLESTGPSFLVDSTAPEITASAAAWYLSPDEASSTGVNDALELHFSCNEDVSAECRIKASSLISGDPIVAGTYPALQAGAEAVFTWDGRDLDGAYVPDGNYKLVIRAADTCGNTAVKELPVVVDNNRQTASAESIYLLHGESVKVNKVTEKVYGRPQVAAVDDDGIVITWSALNQATASQDIYAQLLDKNLQEKGITSEFMVTNEPYATGDPYLDQAYPAITALPGAFVIAWNTNVSSFEDFCDVYAQRFNTDGSRAGDEIHVNLRTDHVWNLYPDIAHTDDGFVITWVVAEQSNGLDIDVAACRFNNNGEKLGEQIFVSSDGWNSKPGVIALENSFVITWYYVAYNIPDTHDGIHARAFNNDGTCQLEEFTINSQTYTQFDYSGRIAITGIEDGYVIAWSAILPQPGIYARIFDSAHQAAASDFTVATSASATLNKPVLTSIPGGFLVTWAIVISNKHVINGRLFDNSGLPLTEEFTLANISTDINPEYSITSSEDSLYLTWLDRPVGETTADAVYAKKIDILHSASGGNLRAQLLYPTGSVYTDRDIPVKAMVSDLNLDNYTLTLTDNSGSSTLLKTETGKAVNGDLYLLPISQYQKNQLYTVTLSALDKAGNIRQDSFTFTRKDSPDFITAFTLDREYCSAAASPGTVFTLYDQAAVTLKITDTSYLVQKTINLGALSQGMHSQQLDISGLADGSYYLILEADNSSTVYSSSLFFTVDNTLPQATLGITDIFFGSTAALSVPVQAAVSEANLSQVILTIEDTDQNQLLELVNSNSLQALTAAAFNPHTLAEGAYIINLLALDKAGNSSTAAHSFQVDRTAPSIELAAPDFTAVQSGSIPITAHLADLNGIYETTLIEPYHTLLQSGTNSEISFTWDSTADFPGAALDITLQVTATDRAGNTAVACRTFTLDNHSPKVQFVFQTAPVAGEGGLYINAADTVALVADADDACSDIQAVYYSVNDGEWNLYTAALPFSTEGAFALKAYGEDNHGNCSAVEETAFTVDATAPAFTAQIDDPRYVIDDKIYIPLENNITITVTGENGSWDSGLWKLRYKTGDRPFTDYNINEGIRIYSEGAQDLTVRAVDKVGNCSTQSIGTFNLDLIPPRTQLIPDCTSYYSSQRNIIALSASAAVTLTADDPGITGACSGVASTWYTLDGNPPTLYTEPLSIGADQVHTLRCYSVDNVGNTEQSEELTLAVDTLPPQAEIIIKPGAYYAADVIYIKSGNEVGLAANDNFAGVRQILYCINGGTYTAMGEQISFGGVTDAELSCYAVDYLDQQSPVVSSHIVIDALPPVTTWQSTLPVTGADGNYHAFTTDTLTWSAVDAGSGMALLSVSINGTPLEQGTFAFTFASPGEYSAEYFSADRVGNIETIHTLLFRVTTPLMGDVNLDGVITMTDASLTADYGAGMNPPGFYSAYADMDGNGIINIVDALIIGQLASA